MHDKGCKIKSVMLIIIKDFFLSFYIAYLLKEEKKISVPQFVSKIFAKSVIHLKVMSSLKLYKKWNFKEDVMMLK